MLGRGGIKNPSSVASRTSRSRKAIGGQLEAILDPIFAIDQEDPPTPDRTEFPSSSATDVETRFQYRSSPIKLSEQAPATQPPPSSFRRIPTAQREPLLSTLLQAQPSRCWPKTSLGYKRLMSCMICGWINIYLFHR